MPESNDYPKGSGPGHKTQGTMENGLIHHSEEVFRLQEKITALEKEIDDLKKQEKQLVYAMKSLENNPDGVFWIGSFGRLLYVNEAACRKLGYTKEELLNMTLADFDTKYSKDSLAPDTNMIQAIARGETTHFQTLHKHRDGHLIPVEVANSIITHEEEGIGCSIVRDITERVKAEEQQKQTYVRLSVLYEVSQKISKGLDPGNLARNTAKILKKSLSFDALLFYLVDEDTGELTLIHSLGVPTKFVEEARRNGHLIGATEKTIRSKQTTYIKYGEETDNPAIQVLLKNGFTDAVSFPVADACELFGGITLINKNNRVIDYNDQELLEAVCRQLSTALKKARLFASLKKEIEERKQTEQKLKEANLELEKSASTDQLTGAWNRRFFLNTVAIEMKRARRHKHTMSILLFDIDNFKEINDKYGHQKGDKVLVRFSNLLKASIRDTDSLTRWGGEEFIVLALHLSEADAAQLADRLRVLISAHNFRIEDPVTVSIGIAEFNYEDDLDSWIRRADDALYKAKELGRNRVELSDPSPKAI